MKKTPVFATAILVCLLVGFISSLVQREALAEWYPLLAKSPLTPPNYIFPIVWSLLYIAMGSSIGLIACARQSNKRSAHILFVAQLLLNFVWCFGFFHLRNPLLGVIIIAVLTALAVWYAIVSFRISRAASILFFPYIAWLGFAAYLNLYIFANN